MGGVITIAGLGPGDPDLISLGTMECLRKSGNIWLRTGVHPAVEWLRNNGISFNTFDSVYQESEDFQEVYRLISMKVLELGRRGDVLYAVPGHPLVAEESVGLIMEAAAREGLEVRLMSGVSFLDAVFAALGIDPAGGLLVVDGLRLGEQRLNPGVGTVIIQSYSRMVLSDIKLSLMDFYPDDHPVAVVTAAGVPGEEQVERCPLHRLDMVGKVNHLTSVYVPPLPEQAEQKGRCFYPLDPLVNVMARLRGGGGCPWDREQDHLTLRRYLLEEAYEAIEAMDRQDVYNICEELGDLLLQIVFHARIASEGGHFDINDVVEAVTEKMIRRHPHVFGGVKAENSVEVLANWAAIKEREKPGGKKGLADSIPVYLPSLMKAQKVQRRAAGAGFDWPDYRGALDKVYEELEELKEAIKNSGPQVENEAGDILFAVVNLARLLKIDAEVALNKATNKFIDRFRYVEQKAARAGKKLDGCSLEEMDDWWEEIKKVEKSIKK